VPVSFQRAFGIRIRELRLAAGMTQDDLADRCGIFRTYMSRLETGKANPTLSMIHALAGGLRVPVVALFGEPTDTARPGSTSTTTSRGRASR